MILQYKNRSGLTKRQMKDLVNTQKWYRDEERNSFEINQGEMHNIQVNRVKNEEVKNCIQRCWVVISKNDLFMKEIEGIMNLIDVNVSSMIKWGVQRMIMVCGFVLIK